MAAGSELCARFAASHPDDAAHILEHSPPDAVAALLETLAPEIAAELLKRMHVPFAAPCLDCLHDDAARAMCVLLPPQHMALLLRRAAGATAERILGDLPDAEAARLRRLLRHPEGTAAAIADQQALTLPDDITVGEARKRLQNSAADVTYDVYVVDRGGRLQGVSDIRRLFQAHPKDTVASIMRADVVRLFAGSDLATVAAHPGWRDFDALPVVDETGSFLGIVWHRRVRQIIATADSDGPTGLSVLTGMADLYWITLADLVAGLGRLVGRTQNP